MKSVNEILEKQINLLYKRSKTANFEELLNYSQQIQGLAAVYLSEGQFETTSTIGFESSEEGQE